MQIPVSEKSAPISIDTPFLGLVSMLTEAAWINIGGVPGPNMQEIKPNLDEASRIMDFLEELISPRPLTWEEIAIVRAMLIRLTDPYNKEVCKERGDDPNIVFSPNPNSGQ